MQCEDLPSRKAQTPPFFYRKFTANPQQIKLAEFGLKAHQKVLISVSLAISQTLVYTARAKIRG